MSCKTKTVANQPVNTNAAVVSNAVFFNKIKAKLELDDDLAEDLLKRGKLNISLDGLNEIENKIKEWDKKTN